MNNLYIKNSSILLVFVALSFLIYSNTLEVPFIFDDTTKIQNNPHVRITKLSFKKIAKAAFNEYSAINRPVGNITFALNYYFHQYNLRGYHLVNITIHILTGIFLYLLIKTTLNIPLLNHKYDQSGLIAFFSALLWLAHPIQTQSITYIVQRLNSMAAMFYILAFLLYVKGRIRQRRLATQNAQSETGVNKTTNPSSDNRKTAFRFPLSAYGLYFSGAILGWILALGCKQIAATLPFFILLYEWYFFQDLNKDWLKRHLKYFVGMILLFGLIGLIYLEFDPWGKIKFYYDRQDFTFTERVLTQFRVVLHYISLLFFPHPSRLNLDYDYPLSHSLVDPITTLLSLCSIIGFLGLAGFTAKKNRLVSFCIFWFFGNLVIESSVIPLAIIFEHRTYLPSMLVSAMTATLIFRYIKPKWLAVSVLCGITIVCSIWTYQRNSVWGDGVTFWRDCVEKSPNKARPHLGLGEALLVAENTDEAIVHLREAFRIKPDFAEAHFNMGCALLKQEKIDEAMVHLKKALKIKPIFPDAQINLGDALVQKGRFDEAMVHLKEALKVKPYKAELHINLGASLVGLGKINEAIDHYREALRIEPDNADAKNNLNSALKHLGKIDEEIAKISEAIKLHPENPEPHYDMAILYQRKGELDEAIENYQKALSIYPNYLEALNNLAIVHSIKGDDDRSLHLLEKIIELQPDNTGNYYNIACIYAKQNKIEESIEWLKKAIEKGYNNWTLIKTDRDLDNVRHSSEYKALIESK